MAAKTIREKTVDLPPTGPMNADPITDAPGAHPIEAGVGAALGGAATGFFAGVAAGPIGAVAGAIIGGIAGGYAGKGVGELIDPTMDEELRIDLSSQPYMKAGETYDDYEPAYQHAARAESNNVGRSFSEVETGIQKEYENTEYAQQRPWVSVKPAVETAYNRIGQARKTRLNTDRK